MVFITITGSATIADKIGDAFQPTYIPQQEPLELSQYYTSPVYPPRQIMDDQRYETSLSETTTTKLKIEELERLLYKYPQFHNDPDEIVRLVVYNCINGDNTRFSIISWNNFVLLTED